MKIYGAKFLAKKFGSKEKSATFALPNEKWGSPERATQQVH
jgi:hypothetical protein